MNSQKIQNILFYIFLLPSIYLVYYILNTSGVFSLSDDSFHSFVMAGFTLIVGYSLAKIFSILPFLISLSIQLPFAYYFEYKDRKNEQDPV